MKNYLKISCTVVALFVASSFAFAELAGSKGQKSAPEGVDVIKSGCPARPKIDAKTAKQCPKALGSLPLELEEPVEYFVSEYHPETESYAIMGVEAPDEGDFPVTLEALAKSDATISDNKGGEKMAVLKKALTSPCDILKRRFKLKKIATLSDEEIKARKNCVRK